jgi:outer membrane protein TolC
VRLALSALGTTAEAVRAADQSLGWPNVNCKWRAIRFGAGAWATISRSITAQTTLADARDAQITALAQYNAARLNLAAALGRAQSFRW